ncbi:ProQ/FINO family protein [Mesorhizobium huakuii]|uniref:ProQ/FinO domain-containing protein n=1 Tax=Mesorhizobium huakuii TaxID=28104 RepID=A0A7G6SMD2_9HYPH|nr:hypothetical protein HB778_02480 [Mesorhizobium huakuii]
MPPSRRCCNDRRTRHRQSLGKKAYPLAFDRKNARPLKIGIREDMLAAGHGAVEVSVGLGWYTRRQNYGKRQIEGAVRVDLAGQPAGTVTAAQAAHAAKALVRRAAKAGEPAPEPPKAPTLQDSLSALREAARGRREGKSTGLPDPAYDQLGSVS